MSTIDMSKVAGFKAVDSEGNEMGIVSMNDIVDAVKSSINQQGLVAARQISTLAATSTLADTSTLAATDSYEDQLPQKTDVTWVRGLDADGNPILISKQSLSSVLEELIGEGTRSKSGLTIKRVTPLLIQTSSINQAIRFHPTNQYAMFNWVITSYINGRVTCSRVLGNMVGNVYKTILSGTTEAITIYRSKDNTAIVMVPTNSKASQYRISFDACETESDIKVIDASSVDLSEYVQL